MMWWFRNTGNLSLLLLFVALVASTVPLQVSAECKACLFDGNDPADCIIYGKLGDQVVEWNTGSRECKGWYQIAISSIDPNTSCRNVNDFVNSLRFGDLQYSDSKLGLGVGSDGGAFFTQNTAAAANNRIDMVDRINIDGTSTNCAASANACWNAMKPYFESDPAGSLEFMQVCNTLFNKVRVDRNLEESVLRNRLCQEHKNQTLIITDCNPLALQVGELVKQNSSRACSGYGFETPLSQVAGCENVLDKYTETPTATTPTTVSSSGGSGSTTTTTNDGGSSGSGRRSAFLSLFVVLAASSSSLSLLVV